MSEPTLTTVQPSTLALPPLSAPSGTRPGLRLPENAPAPIPLVVRVSDNARTSALRDYLSRRGLHAAIGDNATIEVHSLPTADPRTARAEIEAFIDSWVRTNRVAVQLT